MGLFDIDKKRRKKDWFDNLMDFSDKVAIGVNKLAGKLEEWEKKERNRINNKETYGYVYDEDNDYVEEADISDLKYKELTNLNGQKININYEDPFLFYICGDVGKGKSAIGMKILENTLKKTDTNCIYAVGFRNEDLPDFVNPLDLDNIDTIEENSIIILDEGGLALNSREFMKKNNIAFGKLLNVRRHLNTKLIIISQVSSNIDINVLRSASHLIFKPFSLLQKEMERGIIGNIYNDIEREFDKKFDKYGKRLAYMYSKKYKGFILNSLPSFWSNELSKACRRNK